MNASKSMPESSVIRIRVRLDGGDYARYTREKGEFIERVLAGDESAAPPRSKRQPTKEE